MPVRYPAPLAPGDRVGVTAPSLGVPAPLRPRLDHCCDWLRERGFQVTVGSCLAGDAVVSAPAADRAAEFSAMALDPEIRAIVPPWGGLLLVEILPHLDFAALVCAEPTWIVGYSDMSTLMLPFTLLTGVATLHGQNLMDTPYALPTEVHHWTEVAATPAGDVVRQTSPPRVRSATAGFDDFAGDPSVSQYTLDAPGGWELLDNGAASLDVSGRLIGGCTETIGTLAGTEYGDIPRFVREHSADGVIVYLEAAEDPAPVIALNLWRMRLAGWFDGVRAVLIGRTHAPANDGLTQRDAVVSALGDLPVPVVLDVDCGHVPPALALVNGALTRVHVGDGGQGTITQTLA